MTEREQHVKTCKRPTAISEENFHEIKRSRKLSQEEKKLPDDRSVGTDQLNALPQPMAQIQTESTTKTQRFNPESTKHKRGARRSDRFIPGGNVNDPLNLRSVKPGDQVEELEKPIEPIIPRNKHDPLNLLSTRSSKRHRNKKKQKNSSTDSQNIPSTSATPQGSDKHVTSAGKPSSEDERNLENVSKAHEEQGTLSDNKNEQQKIVDNAKPTKKNQKQKAMLNRYRYGNFNNYRTLNRESFQFDPRVDIFCEDWFNNRKVLDIGCNAGLMAISIAVLFSPRKIVGIDLDHHLIMQARKNIAPTQAPPSTSKGPTFPDNIIFLCENYVFDTDEQLNKVSEEWDIITAISIVKWVHLNWGDIGLKRFFKRIFRNLTAQGRLIVNFENYDAYRRCRNKMTPEMEKNFEQMSLLPEKYCDYLLSSELGFSHHEVLDTPLAAAKGKL
ncbi:bicoid-interacting protein 3 (Bin3) domain-containing protein [Ditylenchus destructor]|uniref:RNA methyltransferase n=1 Tax=Ditylenchus destructor TaxID=166010 RepID=A0AAD4R0S6_9BILA|nr:bicoid-interacting protein 3 (Bin3) domain-containing protein [Ditylenchus destructor]